MSCRRAYEIDLAAFLEAPRRESFDDFRTHYPSCAACAAEVRAWTELHLALAATGAGEHPEPERLLRYDEDPGQLAPAEREGISSHLARCASCRDELSALRTFDPAALALPAAEPTPGGASGDGFLDRLRRLVWHPAFAYAVALLVLAPTLWQLVGPDGVGTPALRAPLESVRRDEAVPGERAADLKSLMAQETPADTPGKEKAAALEDRAVAPAARAKKADKNQEDADAAPEPADLGAIYSGYQRERLRPEPAQEKPSILERESAVEEGRRGPSTTKRQAAAPAPSADALAASENALADAAPAGAASERAAEPKAEAEQPVEVELTELDRLKLRGALGYVVDPVPQPRAGRDAGGQFAEGLASLQKGIAAPRFRPAAGGFTLHVPTAGIQGDVEVRLRSPDGRRELVERFSQVSAAGVELYVPATWLRLETYRVELTGPGGQRSWNIEAPR